MLTDRIVMALGLFLIASLHTLIFAIYQIPENFLLGHNAVLYKSILYATAVGASVGNPFLCRRIGLKKMLHYGLVFNGLGVATLWLNGFQPHGSWEILSMLLFGISLTSVINSLVTYIVLEFPKKVGLAVVALFIFLNGGVMLGPLVFGAFQSFHQPTWIFPFLIALLLLSLWFVQTYFFDPSFPAHLAQVKRGTLLWKELHYRLALYVIAIVAYGLTESTFSLWGYVNIKDLLGGQTANEIISFFWLFLIFGQIFLLLPLYFLPAKGVFSVLVLVVMGAGYFFAEQTTRFGLISGLAAAGFGCSAVFPLVLSMMEKEIATLTKGRTVLLYIEMAISLMIAGYVLGVGISDLWVELFGQHPLLPLSLHFQLAALYIGLTGLIVLFLTYKKP